MKLKLDQDRLIEDFFDTTRLLGIMAPIKNYHFCWQVNNVIGTAFKLNNEIEIQLKKKNRDYYFNVYEFNEPETALTHYLYYNHYDGEYLLPEFRNMDFLWLMKGEVVEERKCTWLIDAIKTIASVQLVAELTNEKIKNKGNLVF
ncbi:MAG: IPExxxVDY family protein [Bacteroidetes bacterium]|jgi:hypothetical protein|nr:IPExxxVDY family protein [Bacteroidota bacterium]